MVDIAILNTSEDTIALLREVVADEGWSAVSDFIALFRHGQQDIGAFFREYQPRAVLYDLSIPYEENWRFLLEQVVPASGMSLSNFVLTTTNKKVLEQTVGATPAIELVGKPFDIEEIVAALRRALSAT